MTIQNMVIKREVGKYYYEKSENDSKFIIYAHEEEQDYYIDLDSPNCLEEAAPIPDDELAVRKLASAAQIKKIQKLMDDEGYEYKQKSKVIEVW